MATMPTTNDDQAWRDYYNQYQLEQAPASITNYSNPFQSTPTVAGTTGYNATSPDISSQYLDLQGVPTGHVKKKYWYRKYRRWTDAWRQIANQSLGLAGQEALDPLAQLQQQLGSSVNADQISQIYNPNYNLGGMVGAQQKALGTALQQRAAALGIQGGFGGVMDEMQRARNTVAEQSLAAYRPQAYQAQQQMNDQTQQLMDALARAEFEAESAVAGAGRQA